MMPNQEKNLFDVSLWKSCAIAAPIVVAGYLLILPMVRETLVGRVLVKSEWIGEMIIFLGVWSLVMIIVKGFGLSNRRKWLEEDLLPEAIDPFITYDNAHEFIRYLQSRRKSEDFNLVSKRLELALEKVAFGNSPSEVLQDLQTQSQVDVDKLESSYTMIRTFIWAIPILGFIGTVLGIGQAISGFASSLESAKDMVTIKTTLGHVVKGLAFAFDTTFLGLMISLVVMFPMNVMLRAEQGIINLIDDFYTQHLGRRFRIITPSSELSKAILRSLEEGRTLSNPIPQTNKSDGG
jgi:biopolymer transport protein ExbB/TolQ